MIKRIFYIFIFIFSFFLPKKSMSMGVDTIPKLKSFALIKPIKKDLLFVKVKLNGYPAIFLMDTGASITVIDINQISDYNITSSDYVLGEFSGIGGSTDLYTTEVSYITINDDKFYINPSTSDLNSVVNSLQSTTGLKIVGILGSDFFSSNKIIIDYNRDYFYIVEKWKK